jgi:hypothetical protein
MITESIFIHWIYKAILAFFVVVFMRNLFDRKATISTQIMNGFVLIPFVLRLFSIR